MARRFLLALPEMTELREQTKAGASYSIAILSLRSRRITLNLNSQSRAASHLVPPKKNGHYSRKPLPEKGIPQN